MRAGIAWSILFAVSAPVLAGCVERVAPSVSAPGSSDLPAAWKGEPFARAGDLRPELDTNASYVHYIWRSTADVGTSAGSASFVHKNLELVVPSGLVFTTRARLAWSTDHHSDLDLFLRDGRTTLASSAGGTAANDDGIEELKYRLAEPLEIQERWLLRVDSSWNLQPDLLFTLDIRFYAADDTGVDYGVHPMRAPVQPVSDKPTA